MKTNFDDAKSPTLGAEFICTSISSGGDGSKGEKAAAKIRADNPHIKFHNSQRGYTLLDFDRTRCEASFHAVNKVSTPGGKMSAIGNFTVEAGKPGIA
jgi:alkaline phosphatase D